MNYYRRYIGDYGRDTATLSLAEHGAYALLLDHYYASEAPLPADREDIYRMARAVKPEERKAVDNVLEHYFTEGLDGFHNHRADAELDRAKPAIEAARINGKRGGRRDKAPPEIERKRALPATWEPSDSLKEWTVKQNPDWDEERIQATLASFRDHWKSKGERRLDWDATWRNWIRREAKSPARKAKTNYDKSIEQTEDWVKLIN